MSSPSTFLMAPSSPVTFQRSPWHSPVPYLFGGLAAMMALIAFALILLACSYWKLSQNLRNAADGDLEAGSGAGDCKPDVNKIPTVFGETYLVIMAGNDKPTFLATSSFGCNSCRSRSTTDDSSSEMETDESSDQVQVRTMESRVSAEQVS